MQIGEFIKTVETTKDTVRYYEELGMICPSWQNNRRIYAPKDIQDFQAIKEMQAFGLSLKEVQGVFGLKRSNGCGSPELLGSITEKLQEQQRQLQQEEQELKYKQEQIGEMLDMLRFVETERKE
ncbi:MerR family transcriptional regulator [Lentibacillus sp. N15]|uniref:MerR family transcriptional regulator n=1 Tax=Lentibacillus songyuanensis TaxID=3136161 RepID=UPI0031BA2241